MILFVCLRTILFIYIFSFLEEKDLFNISFLKEKEWKPGLNWNFWPEHREHRVSVFSVAVSTLLDVTRLLRALRECVPRDLDRAFKLLKPSPWKYQKDTSATFYGQAGHYGQPTFKVKGIGLHLSMEGMIKNVEPSIIYHRKMVKMKQDKPWICHLWNWRISMWGFPVLLYYFYFPLFCLKIILKKKL